jgi:hypothetical protein
MEEEKNKKKFLMKVGVISIMFLILIFWFLNINKVFTKSVGALDNQNNPEWQRMKNDFNETIVKMSKSLDEIEATNEKLKAASSSLVQELIEVTKKISPTDLEINTSTEISTSTELVNSSTQLLDQVQVVN